MLAQRLSKNRALNSFNADQVVNVCKQSHRNIDDGYQYDTTVSTVPVAAMVHHHTVFIQADCLRAGALGIYRYTGMLGCGQVPLSEEAMPSRAISVDLISYRHRPM